MDIGRLVEKWLRLTPEDREVVEQLVDEWLAEAEAEQVSTSDQGDEAPRRTRT